MKRFSSRIWIVMCASSPLLFCGCSNDGVLYRIGRLERRAQNPASERMEKAWQMYADGELFIASELAKTQMHDGECSAQAIELMAVIDTREGNGNRARLCLEEAIRERPEASELRKVYLWSLITDGYQLDAERESLRAARECSDDLELWDYYVAIRGRSQVRDHRDQIGAWIWKCTKNVLLALFGAAVLSVLGFVIAYAEQVQAGASEQIEKMAEAVGNFVGFCFLAPIFASGLYFLCLMYRFAVWLGG